jgi:intracellular septation protein
MRHNTAADDERRVNPVLRQVLELGPPLGFFVAYLRLRDETYTIAGIDYEGFIIAAAGFVPVLLVTMGILWKLTGRLSRLQAVTAVLVVVFGGLTVWFNDETFFKMKTTACSPRFSARGCCAGSRGSPGCWASSCRWRTRAG